MSTQDHSARPSSQTIDVIHRGPTREAETSADRDAASRRDWDHFREAFGARLDEPWSELGVDEPHVKESVREILERVDQIMQGGQDLDASATANLPDITPAVALALQDELQNLRREVGEARASIGPDPASREQAVERIESSLEERRAAIQELLTRERANQAETTRERSAGPAVTPGVLREIVAEYEQRLEMPWSTLGPHEDRIKDAVRAIVDRVGDLQNLAAPEDALAEQLRILRGDVGRAILAAQQGRITNDQAAADIERSLATRESKLTQIEAEITVTASPEAGNPHTAHGAAMDETTAEWRTFRRELGRWQTEPWVELGPDEGRMRDRIGEVLLRGDQILATALLQGPDEAAVAARLVSELRTELESLRYDIEVNRRGLQLEDPETRLAAAKRVLETIERSLGPLESEVARVAAELERMSSQNATPAPGVDQTRTAGASEWMPHLRKLEQDLDRTWSDLGLADAQMKARIHRLAQQGENLLEAMVTRESEATGRTTALLHGEIYSSLQALRHELRRIQGLQQDRTISPDAAAHMVESALSTSESRLAEIKQQWDMAPAEEATATRRYTFGPATADDPQWNARWNDAWQRFAADQEREAAESWHDLPVPVEQQIERAARAMFERHEQLRQQLDVLQATQEANAIRYEILQAAPAARNVAAYVRTEVAEGRMSAAQALERFSSLMEFYENGLRVQEEQVLDEALRQSLASGELKVSDLAGGLIERYAVEQASDVARQYQPTSMSVRSDIAATLAELELAIEENPGLDARLRALQGRSRDLFAELSQNEQGALERGQAVRTQLEVIIAAQHGLRAIREAARGVEAESPQARKLERIERLYESALAFSESPAAANLIAAAGEQVIRYQLEGKQEQLEGALASLQQTIGEALSTEGHQYLLLAKHLATEEARKELHNTSYTAHYRDMTAIRETLAEAKRLRETGDFQGAWDHLRRAGQEFAQVEGRYRILSHLDVVLRLSDQMAHDSSGGWTYGLTADDQTLAELRPKLLTLLERYEQAALPESREQIVRELYNVWYQTPGTRAMFEAVLPAISALLADRYSQPGRGRGPGDAAYHAEQVAGALCTVRNLIAEGKDREAGSQLRTVLQGIIRPESPAMQERADEALARIASLIEAKDYEQAGTALTEWVEADLTRVDPAATARFLQELEALWDPSSALNRLSRDVHEFTRASNEWVGLGILAGSALLSMGAASLAEGLLAGIVGTEALAGWGVWATSQLGVLALESATFTLAEREGAELFLGQREHESSFLAAWARAAGTLLVLKGAGRAWGRLARGEHVYGVSGGEVLTRRLGKLTMFTGEQLTALAAMMGTGMAAHGLATGELMSSEMFQKMLEDNLWGLAVISSVGLAARPLFTRVEVRLAEHYGFGKRMRALEARRQELSRGLEELLATNADGRRQGRVAAELVTLHRERADLMSRLIKEAAQAGDTVRVEALEAAQRRLPRTHHQLMDLVTEMNLGLRPTNPAEPGATFFCDPHKAETVAEYFRRKGYRDVEVVTNDAGVKSVEAKAEGRNIRVVEAQEFAASREFAEGFAQQQEFYQERSAIVDRVARARSAGESLTEQDIADLRRFHERWTADAQPRGWSDVTMRQQVLREWLQAGNEALENRSLEDISLVLGETAHLSESQLAQARALLAERGEGDWSTLVKKYRDSAGISAFDMYLATRLRKQEVNDMLNEVMREVQEQVGAELGEDVAIDMISIGSENFTSDYDVSIKGLGAERVVRLFNERFRETYGRESGVHFDTNIYTEPAYTEFLAYIADQASAVREGLSSNDAVRQFVFEQMATRKSMPEEAWQAYRTRLENGAPRALQQVVRRTFDAAEAAYNSANQRIEARKEQLRGGQEAMSEKQLEARAKNEIYAEILASNDRARLESKRLDMQLEQGAAIEVQYLQPGTEVYTAYQAAAERINTARSSAARRQAIREARAVLTREIRNQHGEALYFASEAYQTAGATAHVVGDLQASGRRVTLQSLLEKPSPRLLPTEYRSSFVENNASLFRELAALRDGAKWKDPSKAVEKSVKFFGRMLDAAHQAGVDLEIMAARKQHSSLELMELMRHTTELELVRGQQRWQERLQTLEQTMGADTFLELVQQASSRLLFELLTRSRASLDPAYQRISGSDGPPSSRTREDDEDKRSSDGN